MCVSVPLSYAIKNACRRKTSTAVQRTSVCVNRSKRKHYSESLSATALLLRPLPLTTNAKMIDTSDKNHYDNTIFPAPQHHHRVDVGVGVGVGVVIVACSAQLECERDGTELCERFGWVVCVYGYGVYAPGVYTLHHPVGRTRARMLKRYAALTTLSDAARHGILLCLTCENASVPHSRIAKESFASSNRIAQHFCIGTKNQPFNNAFGKMPSRVVDVVVTACQQGRTYRTCNATNTHALMTYVGDDKGTHPPWTLHASARVYVRIKAITFFRGNGKNAPHAGAMICLQSTPSIIQCVCDCV